MYIKWKKRKFLQRYIITYFFVFAVPLALFSYSVYKESIETFSKQYIEISDAASKTVSMDLTRLLDLAESNANTVRKNPHFTSNNIRNFAGSFVYVGQMMTQLSSLNKDFYEIAFYSKESDLVYTSSIYKKDFYFEHIFHSPFFGSDTDFSDVSASQWIPMQPVKLNSRSTYVSSLVIPVDRRIENGKRTTKSVLITHLEIDRIHQVLSPVTALPDTHVVAFYNDMPILSDTPEILQFFTENPLKDSQYTTLHLFGSSYIVRWADSSEPISVLTLLPEKNIKLLASDILSTYLLSLLLSTLIAVLLIVFSIRRNYRPIFQLLQKAVHIVDIVPDEIQFLDEIEQTSYALDNLAENKMKSEEAHRKMKLKHVLLRLLENSSVYSRQTSFANHLQELGIDFSAKSYCCILFSQCPNPDILINALSHPHPDFNGRILGAEDLEETNVVALLCCEEENMPNLYHLLNQIPGMYSRTGIGTFVTELSNVTLSYKQAYHALIANNKNPGIYEYSNLQIIQEKDILAQFSKETELFSSAVVRKEQSKMRLSLSRISDLLELLSTKDSLEMFLHHVLFVGVKALAAANIPFSSTIELFENMEEPNKPFSEKDWLQTFSAHLTSLLDAKEINENSPPADDCIKDIQYALLYINSNYTKETFSLKLLADEMGMSVSNLSHFFKNKMNQNISDYINDLRTAQAKRLLSETDLKISEIFPLLGYSHASGFIKSFKQSTGKTPSQYRASISAKTDPAHKSL